MGVIEDQANKSKLAKLLRFKSSKSGYVLLLTDSLNHTCVCINNKHLVLQYVSMYLMILFTHVSLMNISYVNIYSLMDL